MLDNNEVISEGFKPLVKVKLNELYYVYIYLMYIQLS